MDYERAKRELLMHGSGAVGANGERLWHENNFLESLRPYRGLIEKNFHICVEALYVVGEQFCRSEHVDRDLMESLWMMCTLARCWGTEPDGMLRRNRLISDADLRKLQQWIEIFEKTSLGLLSGHPPVSEIERYAQYIIDFGPGENIDFFIPYMKAFLADEALARDPSVIAEALGKLGKPASAALPELRNLSTREFNSYQPHEKCTQEMRRYIDEAIQRIERAD